MLGLRTVLADNVPVNVFDEIDAGIGGAVGALVGENLRDVARGRQVLCVTHLAQVAAYAQKHFCVLKKSGKNDTRVFAEALEGEKRTMEIARMLGGVSDKKSAAFTHAEELLASSNGEFKRK
jgi:DNA repair protein RecN (Recombination protein N)